MEPADTAEASPDISEEARTLAWQAAELADEGRITEAIAIYEAALKIAPLFVPLRFNYAVCLHSAKRFDEARLILQSLRASDPVAADIPYVLGNIQRHTGDLEGSIALYEEALRLRPDYLNAYNNLGLSLDELGRSDEAIAMMTRASRLDPADGDVHRNLGAFFWNAGNLAAAVRSYGEAVRLVPDAPEWQFWLGTAALQNHRWQLASAALRRAVIQEPENAAYRKFLNIARRKLRSESRRARRRRRA